MFERIIWDSPQGKTMITDLAFAKERSALLIIDMQQSFISPKGSLSQMGLDTSRTVRVIEPIQQLKAAFVKHGHPVIYLQHLHRPDGLDAGLIEKVFPPIMTLGHCKAGSWDAQIIDELQPSEQDIIVSKYRFSGFYNTQLDTVLQQLGVDNLVVCGIATNVCVESTVRDAFYRDYNVFVPMETTAAFFEAAETAALDNFRFAFARVVALHDLIRQL